MTPRRSFVTAATRLLIPVILAIGVAVVVFWSLDAANPAFQVTDDGVRDQLLVRDCTDLGRCHRIGAATSLRGFYQGAAWLDLLIAVRLAGGDTATERTTVLILLALSAATVFVVVWRWLRPSIALPAALLMMVELTMDQYPSYLINPSPSAFPDVLTAAGLLCYGLSGQRRFLLLAAFALGIGINVHVGSLSLIPPLLAISMLARPRPWRDLALAVALLIATCLVTSSAALIANITDLSRQGRLLPALVGAVVLVFVAARCGAFFRRLSYDLRAWLLGLILLLPFSLASLWLVLWQGHHFGVTYLHPVLGSAAVLAAAIVVLPFELAARWLQPARWIPTAAALAAFVFIGARDVERASSPSRSDTNAWSVADAAAVAEHARQRGWSFEDMVFRVQSVDCRELITGMSFAAAPPGGTTKHGEHQLQVLRLTRDKLATPVATGDLVQLGNDRVAILREIDSWLRPTSLEACRAPLDSGNPPTCAVANPRGDDALTPERFLFASRSYPEIHSIDLPLPYTATYKIPLSPGAGESRELTMADRGGSRCGWQITHVNGVHVDQTLPSRRVLLHSDNGGTALLVLEKRFGTPECNSGEVDGRYPPCLFEMQPNDPLRAVVDTD